MAVPLVNVVTAAEETQMAAVEVVTGELTQPAGGRGTGRSEMRGGYDGTETPATETGYAVAIHKDGSYRSKRNIHSLIIYG